MRARFYKVIMKKISTSFNSLIGNLVLGVLDVVIFIIDYSIRKGLSVTLKSLQKVSKVH